MAAVNKKKLAIVLVPLLLVIAGFFVYNQTKDRGIEVKHGSPADLKVARQHQPQSSLGNIPEGVLTPNQFNEQSAHYLNKEVKIKGLLIKMSDGSYALVDDGQANVKGIVIYQGATDLHLDKYAAENGRAATKEKPVSTANTKPVIITGTYTTNKPVGGGQPVSAKFIATDITQ